MPLGNNRIICETDGDARLLIIVYKLSQIVFRLLLLGLLFGLIATALAYSLYFSGLSKISQASKVPVAASVELVVATLIGVTAFGESVTIIKIIGILMVLFSILLFSRERDA